jgi:hypothetical protein
LPLFSLAKLLAPIIVENGRLRDALSLVTIELTPSSPQAVGNWRELRQKSIDLVRMCILPDKDLLLPTLGIEKHEALLILASANLQGTEVLIDRIREQLMLSPELQGKVFCQTSITPISLPNKESAEPIEKQVQEVADNVTELVMAVLLKPKKLESRIVNKSVN